MQLTLGLIKPDIALNLSLVRSIEKQLFQHNFSIVKNRKILWTTEICKQFYAQHSEKFFYQRLIEFMGTGPTIALILAKENAISDWRKLMGPTKVYQSRFTHPNTIRGKFGLTDTRNTVHGSDSEASAQQEISIFFPNFNINKWLSDRKSDMENSLLKKMPQAENLNSQLGLPYTWDEYYSTPEKTTATNWFVTYQDMKEELDLILTKYNHIKKVVDIGCGLSDLGESLQRDYTFLDVYGIDVSTECLLQNSTASTGFVTYIVSDIRTSIPFANQSIDLIIDKGTYDAIYRHASGAENCFNMVNEALRVLSPEGIMLQVTTDCPDVRLDELGKISNKTEYNFDTSFVELNSKSNNLPVYMYVVKKLKQS